MIVTVFFGMLPRLEKIEQYEQIEYSNDPKEDSRYARADHSADILQLRQIVLCGRRSECNRNRQCHYDRRVAQREKEPDAEWLPALLQHVPHGIVDRRNVIRVEGMAQTKEIGGQPEP